jgi:uroporphyrin-III C-methyltransferase/precorrin-2 dehydrogenase/sirohydrochlorin ferrochelatase
MPALRRTSTPAGCRWARRFAPTDLDGAWLVQVAVDDRRAAAGRHRARQRRIFCVARRVAATAWTPAVTRHGPVTVAVLGGGDPRRAMTVRDAIRDLLNARQATPLPESPVNTAPGRVALVGAGPGDPELITVKGWRLLTEADVVVADRLVPGLLLDELRPEVELVDASKIPYGPARAQEEINRILVDRARAARSWCGSRAVTRTSSVAAARSCWPVRLPAYR